MDPTILYVLQSLNNVFSLFSLFNFEFEKKIGVSKCATSLLLISLNFPGKKAISAVLKIH